MTSGISAPVDSADIADAIIDALDGEQIRSSVLIAAGVPEDEKVVVIEVISPDTVGVDEFTVRVSRKRRQSR